MYKNLFFDLDGTLTDSEPGIINSIRYALRDCELHPAPDVLRRFIGPPLYDSFRNELSMSHNDALSAIQRYREYFKEKGIFENSPYPSIPEMLTRLKSAGQALFIVTSKPEYFASQVADHFGLTPMLTALCGADLEGKRSAKTDVIRYALEQQHLQPNDVLMIGDRKDDILGAHANHIASLGVLYGYGSRDELLAAGASRLANSVEELEKMVRE